MKHRFLFFFSFFKTLICNGHFVFVFNLYSNSPPFLQKGMSLSFLTKYPEWYFPRAHQAAFKLLSFLLDHESGKLRSIKTLTIIYNRSQIRINQIRRFRIEHALLLLFTLDFYGVVTDSAFGLINCHPIFYKLV